MATGFAYTVTTLNKDLNSNPIFYIVFRLIGLRIDTECSTNKGRVDAVAQTDKYIHVIEFKLNKTSEEALEQIHDKKYYQQHLGSGKEIVLVGANFSTEQRNIESWKTESLPS